LEYLNTTSRYLLLIYECFSLRQQGEITINLHGSLIFLRRQQKLFMQQEKFTYDIVNFCKVDVFKSINLISR